jgi:gelsolin
MEGFETVTFKSKFDKWPKKADAVVSDESRGKVAGYHLSRKSFFLILFATTDSL